jgi:hypothetical protein
MNNSTPQFGTAEYLGTTGSDRCHFCQEPIAGGYYRLNGAMACHACAESVRRELPVENHSDYMRALMFGIGAAVAGMIAYAAFEIMTGIIIGYLSLAVGWMVGKAMMKGSNGHGGRRYQITAALLTYAAVSMAAVPVIIHYAREHNPKVSQQQQLSDENQQLEKEFGRKPESQSPAKTAAPKAKMNPGKALLMLAAIGLASPFLELANPFHGLIGLFILSIGIRIAWQTTQSVAPTIDGPFQS